MKIAKILGLNIKESDREAYLRKGGLIVAEFVACGDLGAEVPMSSYEDDCRQSVLFTGVYGGVVWNRWNKKATPYIVSQDCTGSSLYEFRLRVGFVHVPVPFLGCVQHPSIHKISNSKQMQPWMLGNTYDRPIPRRILEEKGVDRNLFGQTKKSLGVMLSCSLNDMKLRMNSESFSSFYEFYNNHKYRLTFSKRVFYDTMYRCDKILTYFFQLLAKLRIPVDVSRLELRRNPCVTSFLLHWGLSVIENRYKTVQDND